IVGSELLHPFARRLGEPVRLAGPIADSSHDSPRQPLRRLVSSNDLFLRQLAGGHPSGVDDVPPTLLPVTSVRRFRPTPLVGRWIGLKATPRKRGDRSEAGVSEMVRRSAGRAGAPAVYSGRLTPPPLWSWPRRRPRAVRTRQGQR